MNIMSHEVRMYAITISTEECYLDLLTGGKKLEVLVKDAEGVYQEPAYQMLLYLTPEDRLKAHEKIKEMGFKTAAIVAQKVYVNAKYLRGKE